MIKISVVSYNNEAPSEPMSSVFGAEGASIGRSNDNFMVLQDPKRYVSRLQASVKSDGVRHSIVNLSQANPILVNGEEIVMGQDVELKFGDEVQIGLYLLKAESPVAQPQGQLSENSNGSFVSPIAQSPNPAGVIPVIPKPAHQPVVEPTALDLSNLGQSGEDPFADLLGGAVNVPATLAPALVAPAQAPAPVPVSVSTGIAPATASDPLGIEALLGTPGVAEAAHAAPLSDAQNTGISAADPFGFDDLLGIPSSPTHSTSNASPHSTHANVADPFDFNDLLGTNSQPTPHVVPHAVPSHVAQDNVFGFDDLLNTPSHTSQVSERKAAIIPDDFDPFAMPSEAPRNTHDPLSGLSNNDVSLEALAGQNVSIDGLMSSTISSGPSILDPVALGHTSSSETDPLALFASESILPIKKEDPFLGTVASNHVSELNSHFTLPQARQEIIPAESNELLLTPAAHAVEAEPLPLQSELIPATPLMQAVHPVQIEPVAVVAEIVQAPLPPVAEAIEKPAPVQAEAKPVASDSQALDGRALAEAFLRGANLPLDTIPSGVTLEWMEMMGRFVATATDGAVELIASRALVKREVKADLTMIVVRNNNPLKFLPDGQSALIQMLGRKIPGFMNPIEAMEDAYIDLRAHQIGVVAGMRAALDEVLRRFDPELLEKKLKTLTLLESLVAGNRKAKMWDLYAELFKEIYIEAQDDFQTLFGKAFLTAYENQIERFRQESKT